VLETGDLSRQIICEERDFQNAIAITDVLMVHAKKVFSELPQSAPVVKRENREERFYNSLNETFSRKDYVEGANSLDIPDKTAQNYISKFLQKGLIHRDKQDFYIKTPVKETKDLGDC
jgi:Fic family protein